MGHEIIFYTYNLWFCNFRESMGKLGRTKATLNWVRSTSFTFLHDFYFFINMKSVKVFTFSFLLTLTPWRNLKTPPPAIFHLHFINPKHFKFQLSSQEKNRIEFVVETFSQFSRKQRKTFLPDVSLWYFYMFLCIHGEKSLMENNR